MEVTALLSETTTAVLCPAAPSAPGPGLPTTQLSGTAQMQSVDANPLLMETMTPTIETLTTTTTSMTSQPTNLVLAAVKTPTLPSVAQTATTVSCPGLPTTQ